MEPLTGATAQHVGDALSTLASKTPGSTPTTGSPRRRAQALASRGSGVGGADRCQAIAWFSDTDRFPARPLTSRSRRGSPE
ncbi:hypothetical protein BZL30_9405 [Mycobacterium kansasii]|uniref:Uncharacterized protein n=1 Tax=Mycobacterium kansasii TaxID=1768 RepID=A0A1V3W9R8_MYCKA|nr:hypothetical protein BZL30_9405 [Mycobacterium kansasii]